MAGRDVSPWPTWHVNPVFRVSVASVHSGNIVNNAPEFSVFTEITERTEMTEKSDIMVIR